MALSPQPAKGPHQTKVPQSKSKSSCHAGCLRASSIGLRELSQPNSFTESSNKGNMSTTAELHKSITISHHILSVLKVERD